MYVCAYASLRISIFFSPREKGKYNKKRGGEGTVCGCTRGPLCFLVMQVAHLEKYSTATGAQPIHSDAICRTTFTSASRPRPHS